MKKSLIIVGSLLVLIVLAIFFIFHQEEKIGLTGNAVFNSPVTLNCTEESAKLIWDSYFNENATGVEIILDDKGSGDCSYVIYKMNGGEGFMIFAEQDYISGGLKELTSKLVHFILSPTGLSYFGFFNESNLFDEDYYLPRQTSLTTSTLAESYLDTYFNIDSISLDTKQTNGGGPEGILCVDCLGYINSEEASGVGLAFLSADQSFEYIIHSQDVSQLCTSNWTPTNTSCIDDQKTTWFSDANDCETTTGKPVNITYSCDSDANGIIGNISSVSTSNINKTNLKFFINGSELDLSKNYTSKNEVEIKGGTTTLIKFNWSFTNALNLEDITIKRSSASSDEGYIIVNGLNVEKTVYVDRNILNSTEICIKDETISSTSSISDECSGDNETSLNCPDEEDGFSCSLENSNKTYKVTGLMHSAVIEINPCISNWTCSNWSDCTNGSQKRTCNDYNNCVYYSGRPTLTQNCNSSEVEDTFLTNTDPIEETTKGSSSISKTWIIVLSSIFLFIIVAIVIILLYLKLNKKEVVPYSAFSPPSPSNPSQPPTSPPSSGQPPISQSQPIQSPIQQITEPTNIGQNNLPSA